MTTLVTGAPGWLGNALVRRLVDGGRDVRCLVYSEVASADEAELRAFGAQCIRGDILDPSSLSVAMEQVSTVFHAAAELHPFNAKRMTAVNDRGAQLVAAAAVRAGVNRFVHVSSIAVHGSNQDDQQPFLEHDPPNSRSRYGQSKWAGECAVRALAEAGTLPAVVVRPGPYYGPGPSKGMKLLIKLASQFPVGQFGGGQFLRSFVHVENVVDALLLAEASAFHEAEAFLVADARPYTVKELLSAIGAASGKGVRTFALPAFLASMCAGVAVSCERFANTHLSIPTMVSQFGKHCFCSIEKAQSELGYMPTRTLVQGIHEAWGELHR